MPVPRFSLVRWSSDRLAPVYKRWGLRRVLKPGVRLWAGWTALTWLAFLLSLLLVEVGERSSAFWADGLLGGGLVGLAQWRMLPAELRGGYRWVIASLLGWGVLALSPVGAVGWIAPDSPDPWLRGLLGILYGAGAGLVLGGSQWAVLRRRVAQAWRWIPLSAGIWAVAIALGWLVGGHLRATSHLFVSEVIGLVVAWGIVAALTGLALVQLLAESQQR